MRAEYWFQKLAEQLVDGKVIFPEQVLHMFLALVRMAQNVPKSDAKRNDSIVNDVPSQMLLVS